MADNTSALSVSFGHDNGEHALFSMGSYDHCVHDIFAKCICTQRLIKPIPYRLF